MPSIAGVIRTARLQARPGRFLIALALTKTRLSSLFWIHHRDFIIPFYHTAFSMALWINPDCRRADHDFLTAFLRPGDVMIDVGANIGSLSLTASAVVGPSGRVFAFEPHPRIFAFLQCNIAHNRRTNIRARNVAIGDCRGMLRLSDVSTHDDMNHIDTHSGRLAVEAETLDDSDFGPGPISLLKIDVEGYERFVLRGAAKTLGRVACIYFEVWEEHFKRYGYRWTDLWRDLSDAGFAVYRISGEHQVTAIAADFTASRCENLIALKTPHDLAERTGFQVASVVS